MSLDVPTTLLGKPASAPEVQALLKQGGGKDPKRKKDDVNAWLELEKLGLGLVFTDEAFLTKNDKLAIGEGDLILTSVEFWSPGWRDEGAFTGTLPLRVDFRHSRAQVRSLLGQPEWSNDGLGLDRWRIEGVWYFAKYPDEFDRLLTFSMQIPDPE